RDVERLTKACRDCAAEADVVRDEAQRCDSSRRLKPRLQRGMVVGCRHQAVSEKEQVELAAFGNSDAGFGYRPAAVAVKCLVHAPACYMIAGTKPEYGEMQLAFFARHGASPSALPPRRTARASGRPRRAIKDWRATRRPHSPTWLMLSRNGALQQ